MLLGETNGGDGEIYGKQLDVTLSHIVFMFVLVSYWDQTKRGNVCVSSSEIRRHVFFHSEMVLFFLSFFPMSLLQRSNYLPCN